MSSKALLVIDLQNDYFPEGRYPLWNTEHTLINIKTVIDKAKIKNIPVIYIQHIAEDTAPFFNCGSIGAEIHPEIMAAAPDSEIVIKTFADSFEKTNLEALLKKHAVEELLICGMMTQNCVTHTAISTAAAKYKVSILQDCCTTVDEMIHNIALNAISIRVPLVTVDHVFRDC